MNDLKSVPWSVDLERSNWICKIWQLSLSICLATHCLTFTLWSLRPAVPLDICCACSTHFCQALCWLASLPSDVTRMQLVHILLALSAGMCLPLQGQGQYHDHSHESQPLGTWWPWTGHHQPPRSRPNDEGRWPTNVLLLDGWLVVGILRPGNIYGHIKTGTGLWQCTLIVTL